MPAVTQDQVGEQVAFLITVNTVDGLIHRRSEEHTSELQSRPHLVCRLLLEKKKKASRYLVKFSNLVRSNLINSDRTFISLEEELKYLKTYCEIENELHGNRTAITFDIDPKIDRSETEIPQLSIPPFLENAFVHACAQSIKSPELTLTITQLEGEKI